MRFLIVALFCALSYAQTDSDDLCDIFESDVCSASGQLCNVVGNLTVFGTCHGFCEHYGGECRFAWNADSCSATWFWSSCGATKRGPEVCTCFYPDATYSPTSAERSLTPTQDPILNSFSTCQPSSIPTLHPSHRLSMPPTVCPSCVPSSNPTYLPTSQPSLEPTIQPSDSPSRSPSAEPTFSPTSRPSRVPSMQPSSFPSHIPSSNPTYFPTSHPSRKPILQPTGLPSYLPSSDPACVQTSIPIIIPTVSPTTYPSHQPTLLPTFAPTLFPSTAPTFQPSSQPNPDTSKHPSSIPTSIPLVSPTRFPIESTSSQSPSLSTPTSSPTTPFPSLSPTSPVPSFSPTSSSPSNSPSQSPSAPLPTRVPTISLPTTIPTTPYPSSVPTTPFPSVFPITAMPSITPVTTAPSVLPSTLPSTQPSIAPTSSQIIRFVQDYNSTIGPNTTQFLIECSREVSPVICWSVSPGSILVEFHGSPYHLDALAERLSAEGLDLPSFDLLTLDSQEESSANQDDSPIFSDDVYFLAILLSTFAFYFMVECVCCFQARSLRSENDVLDSPQGAECAELLCGNDSSCIHTICPAPAMNESSGCCGTSKDLICLGVFLDICLLGEFAADALFWLEIKDEHDMVAFASLASFVLSFLTLIASYFVQIRECCKNSSPNRRHILRVRWGLIIFTPFLTLVHINLALYFVLVENMTSMMIHVCLVAAGVNLFLRLCFASLTLEEDSLESDLEDMEPEKRTPYTADKRPSDIREAGVVGGYFLQHGGEEPLVELGNWRESIQRSSNKGPLKKRQPSTGRFASQSFVME